MAEAVANVARRINATVEEGKDSLGKTPCTHLSLSLSLAHSALIQYCDYCYFRFHQQVVTEAQVCFAQITIIFINKCLFIRDIQHSPTALALDDLIIIFFFFADLSNCKLISFPDGVFKVLRSVSENIRVITLADNEMKALSSKFFSTFTQLRGRG